MPTTILPCRESITCPGSDSPIQNLSAEAPDLLQFWAIVYGQKPNPIGFGFGTFNGFAVGVSDQSQQDANNNATTIVNNNVQNPVPADPSTITPPPADPNNIPPIPHGHPDPNNPITNQLPPLQRPPLLPPPPISPPAANPPPFGPTKLNSRNSFYKSAATTCEVPCPNGGSYFFNLPPGAVLTTDSQENADLEAQKRCAQIAAQHPMCLGDLPPKICCDQPIYLPIGVTGPSKPTAFQVAAPGILPPGLTFNDGLGIISGVPTTQGTFQFTIKAFTINGNYAQRAYTLVTAQITNGTVLPAATVGVPYFCQLNELGATLPLNWVITDGALPPGIGLDIYTGIISGTPPLTIDGNPNPGGSFTFEVTMQDASNPALACRKTLVLGVAPFVPSPCGIPAYKLQGYGPGVAAAIAALMPSAALSALPEWDGVLRLLSGEYVSSFSCYAIAGKAIEVQIDPAAVNHCRDLSMPACVPFCEWQSVFGSCADKNSPCTVPTNCGMTFTGQLYDGISTSYQLWNESPDIHGAYHNIHLVACGFQYVVQDLNLQCGQYTGTMSAVNEPDLFTVIDL